MISFKTFLTLVDTEIECVEPDVQVEANYTPGRPAVMYLRNGDPGYPEEDDEVEVTKVVRLDTNEELDWDSLSEANKDKLEEAVREHVADEASDCQELPDREPSDD